jgi:uncharacterized protein YgiM (DUF1202 family)
MSLGDRLRRALDGGNDQRGRRPHAQATRIGGYESEGRSLQRGQWIALGVAAAAAAALAAGLVFAILTLTRPGEPRAAGTPTAAAVVTSPVPKSVSELFGGTSTPTQATLLTPTQLPQLTRQQVANTQGQGVNLRREPGPTSELVKIIPEGTLVEVVGEPQDIGGTRWVNVRDPLGDTGWVASGFLVAEGTAPSTPIAAAPTSAPTPAAAAPKPAPAATTAPVAKPGATRGQVGNTGGQGANIRSEPGTGGRVLKTLNEGSNLEVLGPEREVDGQVWRQVRDSTGVTGWIVRGAVVPAGTLPTPVPPGARPTTAASPAPGAGQAATPAPAGGQTPAPAQPAPTEPPAPAATSTPSGNLPVIIAPAATPTPGGAPKPGGSPAPQ